MPTSSKNFNLGWESFRQHENPAATVLEQKLSDKNAIKCCNIYFPVDLHRQLSRHANQKRIPLRELVRTVIENWLVVHASDMDKIQSGEVNIPAVGDGRKTKEDRGELQNIVAHLPRDIHQKLKQVTILRKLTMRGIVVGIMQEWASENCA